jgi:glycyl-tRNA synthetase beta chain
MPVTVGLDAQGAATPALAKKLAALGANDVDVSTLERRVDGKSTQLVWRTTQPGATLAQGLQAAFDETLAALPIPKEMTYQTADGWTSVKFVRPAHRLVALHGADVVHVRALGLDAGRETFGHRFEAHVEPVVLQDAAHYAQQMLAQGAVVTSFDERRNEIRRQLQQAARQVGLMPVADEALLDEVTALVEKPKVLACSFDEAFLEVPPECLVLTMKANQKYFPLLDDAGGLTNRFLVVSNIDPANPARIVEGNERVVRPRLADAKFFFDKDRKTTLESRLPMLDKVVYHAKLGSMGERVARLRAIAREVGGMLGESRGDHALAEQAERAAQLAKADLVTDMVGEFPELQGIMGQYYARHDRESEAVAQAIEDHYKPRFAGDALPRGDVGLCVALADKLETLVGLFAAGEKPSGDKDPFGLRRHALGVIRMLVERDLPLAVPQLIDAAAKALGLGPEQPPPHDMKSPRAAADAMAFVYDRLIGYLRDLGHTAQEVDAVVSLRPPRWAELPRRLAAVKAFAALPESESLAAANKRVANILKKSDATPAGNHDVKIELLREAAEQHLHASLGRVQPVADTLFDRGDHAASLRELAALKAPVDAFFDSVMVNADDAALRANRLALLARLHATMNRVADLSKLAV